MGKLKQNVNGDSLPVESPGAITREAAVRAVYEMAGAARAFEFASASSKLHRLLVLRAIKEHRTYELAGFTWEAFCKEVVGKSRPSIDEEINNLNHFGEDFVDMANGLNLSRAAFRALRQLPEDEQPRVEGGMLQIGHERVPLNAPDKVQEVLQDILAEQQAMKARLDEGEKQINSRDEEVAQLRKEIKALKNPPKPIDLVSDFDRCCTVILEHMNRAVNMIQAEEPGTEPEKVITWVRTWGQLHGFMTQYGANWTPVTELDPELFDAENAEAIMREIEEG